MQQKYVHKFTNETDIRMFIAALFVIALNWKYKSIVEWIYKLWHVHIVNYYTAMRTNNRQSPKTSKTNL